MAFSVNLGRFHVGEIHVEKLQHSPVTLTTEYQYYALQVTGNSNITFSNVIQPVMTPESINKYAVPEEKVIKVSNGQVK